MRFSAAMEAAGADMSDVEMEMQDSSTDLARAWEKDPGMRRRARRFHFVAWLACMDQIGDAVLMLHGL